MELRTEAVLHRIIVVYHWSNDEGLRKDEGTRKGLEDGRLLFGRERGNGPSGPFNLQALALLRFPRGHVDIF